MIATTHSGSSLREPTLFVACELSQREWKLALASTMADAPWLRTVASGDWAQVTQVLAAARRRFGLAADARVVSCYEAGRDGFWIHRALVQRGVGNCVVDSASLEVNRRARRAKTDRIDALKLLRMLLRVANGERGVWHEVQVPAVAVEAARHVSRERTALVQERTRLINQLRAWLTTWGTRLPGRRRAAWWTTVRDWSGTALPDEVQQRIARADARLGLITAQLRALETQQQAAVQAAAPTSALRRLLQVKGVAATSATVLLQEGLEWRAFRNRRQVGAVLGFAATPFQSGTAAHEQGISRAGNRRLQACSVQLAWQWLRWQPASALTQWYRARFGVGRRARRIGIVAVARKLVIALWRYVTQGVVPAGAIVR